MDNPLLRLLLPIAIAVALLGAACSDGDDDTAQVDSASGDRPDTTTPPDDDQATTEESTEPATNTGDDGEEPPPGEPPGGALATVDGQPPFGQLEITALRQVGDTVTLDFVIVATEDGSTGDFRERFADSADLDDDSRQYTASGVTLVDKTNNQRHLVLRDSSGACLCTDFGNADPDEGQRYPGSAQFPAPPEDVEEMTVEFPTFPAVDNVPLRQG